MSKPTFLPLNGFGQHGDTDSSSPEEAAHSAKGRGEDWPDWSDPDESEDRKSQPVRILIEASNAAGPQRTVEAEEEEPWDDFEDTDATSESSPAAPVVLTTPPSGQTTEPLRPGASKPLKLSSTTRPANPPPMGPKYRKGAGGLGEEFTIKVKKQQQIDPELDLFADMVPDIKLSSSPLLVPSASGDAAAAAPTSSYNAAADATAAMLSDKFAAASVTEVSGQRGLAG